MRPSILGVDLCERAPVSEFSLFHVLAGGPAQRILGVVALPTQVVFGPSTVWQVQFPTPSATTVAVEPIPTIEIPGFSHSHRETPSHPARAKAVVSSLLPTRYNTELSDGQTNDFKRGKIARFSLFMQYPPPQPALSLRFHPKHRIQVRDTGEKYAMRTEQNILVAIGQTFQ
jgi:hypothetical protein